jgi:hypothetical protein
MKRLLLFFLSTFLAGFMIFGCGKKEEPKTEPVIEKPQTTAAQETTMVTDTTSVEDTLKIQDTTGGHGSY